MTILDWLGDLFQSVTGYTELKQIKSGEKQLCVLQKLICKF
jgi:hypothetical protein